MCEQQPQISSHTCRIEFQQTFQSDWKIWHVNSKIQNIPYCQSAVAVTDSRVHLELLFFTVFALPNASSTGLDYVHSTTRKDVSADTEIKEEKKTWKRDQFFPTSRTCCSTVRPSVPDLPPMNARYLMSIFVVSVLPAPLSPLTNMDWLPWSLISALKLLPPKTRKKMPIKLQTVKCYCLQIPTAVTEHTDL